MKKHYNYLTIDLDKKVYNKLKAMQYDTKSRYILINLISNNSTYDLTDTTVKIYGVKNDKTIFFNNAVIIDATKGQFEIELTNQALAVEGQLEIQILVLGATGEKLTSSSFYIEVGKSIIDENAIESTNEFNALTEGLKNLAEYDVYRQNVNNNKKNIEEHSKKLDEHSSQIKEKVNFKIPVDTNTPWTWFNPLSNTEVYGGAINKISIRNNIYSRGIEIYNQSGITDGSMTDLTKSKESVVVHHYSDNNVAQLDNVGRGNAILILKNARNSVMAKHSETGRGDYLRCDRDDETEGLQNLFRIKPFNWKDESITTEDKWGICLLGRVGGTNKQVTQVPIMMISKGVSSSEQGEAALYLYSLAYGKECLKLTNTTSSTGALLDINYVSKQANSPAVNISINGSSPAIQMTNKDRTVPFFRLLRTTASYGNIIEVKNENNVDLFKVSGNGKSIFITDSGDGTLRELKIINGAISVA